MTDLIQWNSEFSVGVEAIDNQHKELFRMLNCLLGAIDCGDEKQKLERVLEEMVNYVDYHFKSEEKFLVKLPNFTPHRLEHWEFVKKTMNYQKRYSKDEEITAQEIFIFLLNWLKTHIVDTDVNDFRYLREHNLL